MNDNYTSNYDSVYEEGGLTYSKYLAKCFLWMFAGLLVTFGTALFAVQSGLVVNLIQDPVILLVVFIAEVFVVFTLSLRIRKMSPTTARILFILYALLNAVTFSLLFAFYDFASIVYAFLGSAGFFGVMAFLGYRTKVDLSRLRTVLFVGLIMLLVSTVLGLLIGYLSQDWWILGSSVFGIALFTLITAYDVQKIKRNYFAFNDDSRRNTLAIYGALQLYLDFINIFIYMLRLINRGRR